jgi:hypothetical protein
MHASKAARRRRMDSDSETSAQLLNLIPLTSFATSSVPPLDGIGV